MKIMEMACVYQNSLNREHISVRDREWVSGKCGKLIRCGKTFLIPVQPLVHYKLQIAMKIFNLTMKL